MKVVCSNMSVGPPPLYPQRIPLAFSVYFAASLPPLCPPFTTYPRRSGAALCNCCHLIRAKQACLLWRCQGAQRRLWEEQSQPQQALLWVNRRGNSSCGRIDLWVRRGVPLYVKGVVHCGFHYLHLTNNVTACPGYATSIKLCWESGPRDVAIRPILKRKGKRFS